MYSARGAIFMRMGIRLKCESGSLKSHVTELRHLSQGLEGHLPRSSCQTDARSTWSPSSNPTSKDSATPSSQLHQSNTQSQCLCRHRLLLKKELPTEFKTPVAIADYLLEPSTLIMSVTTGPDEEKGDNAKSSDSDHLSPVKIGLRVIALYIICPLKYPI